MKSINLYGYATSPYVRKTACFLYYKGLDFTHVPVNPIKTKGTIGHTNGTQVPVLEIDGEWRRESSDHAHWLDEIFPEKPLYPLEHQQKIDQIDDWISHKYLPSLFRGAIDGPFDRNFIKRSWRLAALVNAQTPLPFYIRFIWPFGLRRARFINDMSQHIDFSLSIKDMYMQLFMELLEHIGDGPFMGELEKPTMLDFAVFPQLVFGYMFGLEEQLSAAKHPTIKAWLARVSEHLPENPLLASDKMQVNSLKEALSN